MAITVDTRSGASEEAVRTMVSTALAETGARTVSNVPGALVLETGSVAAAWAAGPFRAAMKMPMRISVLTLEDEEGTTVTVTVESRGTAAGMSGGVIGMRKQKHAEQAWLERALEAIPERL